MFAQLFIAYHVFSVMLSHLTFTITLLGWYYCACLMVSEPRIKVKGLNQERAGDEAGAQASSGTLVVVLFFWAVCGLKLFFF